MFSEKSIRKGISLIGSPHYYYGKSLTKLFLHKIVLLLAFFKTERSKSGLLKSTLKYKDYGKGRTALIVGTGPSITSLQLDKVNTYVDDIFAINEYFAHKISETVKPTFYCLSDPAHFASNDDYSKESKNDLDLYLKNTNPIMLLPHWAAEDTAFCNLRKVFFDDREQTWLSKNINPMKPRGYSSVTLYKALAMACHMNYDVIYIIGLDNTNFKSYSGSRDNLLVDNSTVAFKPYDTHETNSGGTPQIKFTSGVAGRMQSYALLFGDLNSFPKDKIVNLSEQSLVDVFEKNPDHPLVFKDQKIF